MFLELKEYLRNMFNYSGRSRRREYWVPMLWMLSVAYILIGITVASIISCMDFSTGEFQFRPIPAVLAGIFGLLSTILYIVQLLAQIAASIRRCHDIGKSGMYFLFCLLGSFVCGLGGIVWLVFCCMDSVEDNQWGPNPKNAEPYKYNSSASIVVSIISVCVSLVIYFGLAFGSMIPLMLDSAKMANSTLSSIATTEMPLDRVEDDFIEEPTLLDDTEEEITEQASTENETASSIQNELDQVKENSDPNNYTDKYTVKIGNANLQVDFDGGCTVTEDNGVVDVYREYPNNTYMKLTFKDSEVTVGDTDSMLYFDAVGSLDEYTVKDSAEKVVYHSVDDVYVSYYIYDTDVTESKIFTIGSIWQDIGAGNYLRIDFITDATSDIQAIVDSSIIALN